MAHPDHRARSDPVGDHGQGIPGREPQRDDQHHAPGERGLQGEAHHGDAGRQPAGPVPVVGGGVLAQQVEAGLVKDITEATSSWKGDLVPAGLQPYTVDGKLYGIPWDIGMVGFWYNKDLFAKAGISAPPKTWAEFLTVVQTIKGKGITPLALAGKDKWPGHFYWAYLAMRTAGLDALKAAAASKDFNTPDFIQAGAHLKALVDLQPFQKGFLAAQYDKPGGQAATMGNGQAAMELMGQWAPVTQTSSSASGKGLGDKLGFFTFPAVDGGKGAATDAFGGGNGFSIGKNAPPATVDFLKFLLNVDNQRTAAGNGTLVTNTAAADAIKDPNAATVASTLPRRRASSSTSTRRSRRPSARRSTTRWPR
ncbi:ABC transporter substrate-binding protein [Luedemannella flava]